MAPHSSNLAWKIPWAEEPGRLQSMGSLGVGHDFTFTFHFHALEKEMAAHFSVLAWRTPGIPRAWWAAVSGVAQSRTGLKQLCSSSRRKGVRGKWRGREGECMGPYRPLEFVFGDREPLKDFEYSD